MSPAFAAMSQADALKELRKHGPKAKAECNASEDEDIQKAKTKANNLQQNQSGDSASNPMRACNDMKNAANEAESALSAFKSKCGETNTKCEQALEALEGKTLSGKDKEYKAACEKLNEDWEKLDVEIKATKKKATEASQCQQDIGGGGQMPQMPQMPQKSPSPTPTPTVEKPKEDCSNPTFAATNPVCVCRANAFAVGCGTDQSPSVEALINDSSQAVEPSSYSQTGGATTNRAAAHDASKLGRFSGGGSSGGAMGGGGGGGGGPSVGRDVKNDTAIKIPASGIGKGGGGGGGGGEGGGAGRVAGGGYGDDPGAGANGRRPGSLRNDSPDLKKYLPDGMSGQHTNIFKNVRKRYYDNFKTLNP